MLKFFYETFLSRSLPTSTIFGTWSTYEAIREAVINSVMHKYYFEHGHNNILKFFTDRIQVENIWLKPRDFILGKTVFRRNQIISGLFARIHFGEKIGSGMQRIREYCKAEKEIIKRSK